MKINKLKKLQDEIIVNAEKQDKVIAEMERVSDELGNIDTIIDNLDEEFAKKTGIFNKKDMGFLFVATALQCVRWILSPPMESLNIKDGPAVDKANRLESNENNHKGGVYDGKDSGKTHENKAVNEYLKKDPSKTESARNEYREKIKNADVKHHRTWLEILLRNVPYDATNAMCDQKGNVLGSIPNIRGLNFNEKLGQIVNINANNHHVATLGHDPTLGWVVGTMNILTNTITFCNAMSFEVEQESLQLDKWRQYINYSKPFSLIKILEECIASCNEDSKRIPAAIARQAMHFASDKYCVQGLPIPFLSSINPEKAQKLIEEGWNSIEAERILKKVGKNLGIIGLNAALAVAINLIIKAIYMFTCDPDDPDYKLMEVRARKIITISNTIASTSNVIATLLSGQYGKLDIGGIGITIVEAFRTKSFIDKVKLEYLASGIEQAIEGDVDWVENVLGGVNE